MSTKSGESRKYFRHILHSFLLKRITYVLSETEDSQTFKYIEKYAFYLKEKYC